MPENENAALKAAVEELKTSNKQETKAGDYIVIKVTGPSPKDIRFFAYDELEKLGAGTFSVVYKAYPVDASTGKLGATQKEIRALKKLRDTYQTTSKDEIRDEVEIFYKHYPRVKPEVHVINNYSHIFTEAFEGGNLIDYKDGKAVLNPSIQALNLSERFQLAFQLAVGFNLFHHNTPTTGAAIILGDIKPANVIIKVVKPAKEGEVLKKFDVYPIDFGFSKSVEDDPQRLSSLSTAQGAPIYMPPEIVDYKRGIKSDIYSMTPLFAFLFGAENPMRDKKGNIYDPKYPYVIDDLFKGYEAELERFDFPIKQVVIQFLNRMQKQNYSLRPDSDEVLRFFTALSNYSLALDCIESLKNQPEKDEEQIKSYEDGIKVYQAQLALLASGLWYEKAEPEGAPSGQTFEQFALPGHDIACRGIAILYKANSLDEHTASGLHILMDKLSEPESHLDALSIQELAKLIADAAKFQNQLEAAYNSDSVNVDALLNIAEARFIQKFERTLRVFNYCIHTETFETGFHAYSNEQLEF